MSERFSASTQYNDLLGTIAIDECQAIGATSYDLLSKLASHADIPDGYEIMGFEITTASPWNLEDHGIMSYDATCIRSGQVGLGADQWRKYADDHGELPVFRFRGRINFDDFRSLLARINVKVVVSGLDGVNLAIQQFKS